MQRVSFDACVLELCNPYIPTAAVKEPILFIVILIKDCDASLYLVFTPEPFSISLK